MIRTSLGPRAMLKMLMDPMGGIVLTNDGNAILREITVKHPAAKSMIEIARTQDEETGDGTTSVIVFAGEVMAQAEQFLEQNIHPTVIIKVFLITNYILNGILGLPSSSRRHDCLGSGKIQVQLEIFVRYNLFEFQQTSRCEQYQGIGSCFAFLFGNKIDGTIHGFGCKNCFGCRENNFNHQERLS